MTIGIIPNTTKDGILEIVKNIVRKFQDKGIDYFICDSFLLLKDSFDYELNNAAYISSVQIGEKCDLAISIGGDGTMLNSAYELRHSDVPLFGLNLGKLGFLAEFDINNIDEFITDIINKDYEIEKRMALVGHSSIGDVTEFYAINDIVIDKGRWPKMIELTIQVDDDYVATFSADGVIVATPTGSTGYSLSTGGPIVSPKTHAITISPISPHTLTMRPLVISSEQRITISVNSSYTTIQINCDGQRVSYHEPPVKIEISKSESSVKLAHTHNTNYFEILRNKLLWGLDARMVPNSKKGGK